MTDEEYRTCLHEAAHASMGLVLGLECTRIQRFLSPHDSNGRAGFANFVIDFGEMDEDMARRCAMAILAGPDAEGQLPQCPLDPSRSHDERLLLAFCERAKVRTVGAYRELVAEMRAYSSSRRYKRLHVVLSAFLEERRVLTPAMINLAKEIAWGREETQDEEIGTFPCEEPGDDKLLEEWDRLEGWLQQQGSIPARVGA